MSWRIRLRRTRLTRVGATLVKVSGWHRYLDLNLAQTPEFTSTPGQVAFYPGGSKLIVATKDTCRTTQR